VSKLALDLLHRLGEAQSGLPLDLHQPVQDCQSPVIKEQGVILPPMEMRGDQGAERVQTPPQGPVAYPISCRYILYGQHGLSPPT